MEEEGSVVKSERGGSSRNDKFKQHGQSLGICAIAAIVLACAVCGGVWVASRAAAARQAEGLQDVTEIMDKPRSDARTYMSATLENGMQVLAVQDERSRTAAFAAAVQVGSYDDPPELPGLSHFTEHMLFLGTKQHPIPDEFDKFVSRNGPANPNAYTASEATVYYFGVSQTAAAEGLERFSDFFRAPLFNKEYVEKEVHAIDSEHAKNIQDPTRRSYAVLSALANPASAVSKFGTGNIETLQTIPKKKGIDPIERLREHFARHYCPHRMRVVSFGPMNAREQLQAFAKTFGQVPEAGALAGQDMPSCSSTRPSNAEPAAWPKERLGKWVDIQGTTPQPSLVISFALPDVSKKYEGVPLDYLDYVLTYKGKNSLFYILRDTLGLVNGMRTEVDSNSAGSLLLMHFDLSEEGRQKLKTVLDEVFAYLVELRRDGADSKLYKSIAQSWDLQWQWREPTAPIPTAMQLAATMTRMPTKDILWGDQVVRKPDPDLVFKLLGRLLPALANVGFVDPRPLGKAASNKTGGAPRSNSPPAKDVQELPYYGVRYAVRSMEAVLPGALATWESWASAGQRLHDHKKKGGSHPGAAEELQQRAEYKGDDDLLATAPRPLKGLPDQKSITSKHSEAVIPAESPDEIERIFGHHPEQRNPPKEKLKQIQNAREHLAVSDTWFRQGWRSNAPKFAPGASITVLFRPLAKKDKPEHSAKDIVNMRLYGQLLNEEIDSSLVDIPFTGAAFNMQSSADFLKFSFGGLDTVRRKHTVTKVAKQFADHASLPTAKSRFARVSHSIKESLEAYSSMPITYAINDRSVLLTKGQHSKEDLLEALKTSSAKSASKSLQHVVLSHPLEATSLAMGNLEETELWRTITSVAKALPAAANASASAAGGSKGLAVERFAPIVAVRGPVELRKANPRKGDPNDAIVVSLVDGVSTVESRVILGLLGQILGRVAFGELRTAMQLGYVVNAGSVQLSNVQVISCVVQGTARKADDLEAAVERVYTKVLPERLAALTTEEFESYKASMVDQMLQPPFFTADEVGHFWGVVVVGQAGACSGLQSAMLQYLRTVTMQDLQDKWQQLAMPADGVRRKVMVKYFADQGGGQVPPERPSWADKAKALKAQGVPDQQVKMLEREYKQTLLLDRADASARAAVMKANDNKYFPDDLICTRQGSSFIELGSQPTAPSNVTAFRRHSHGFAGRTGAASLVPDGQPL